MDTKQTIPCCVNKAEFCDSSSCATCGWNKEEHARRVDLLHTVGLEKTKDGLKALILRKGGTP